jgi:hypothetical protein
VIPLVVVDAANVVGSVPDGWWRDRPGAATRLRDALVGAAVAGVDGPVEFVLVVEGAAREVPGVDGVRVMGAPGSGDDAIVAVVADAVDASGASGRRVIVVTADRGLSGRVRALGAEVTGPRSVPRTR